jgi:pyrroloquinoline quinone (PQQ) biosynthesis protein C
MVSEKQIADAFGKAAAEFAGSDAVSKLLAGKSSSAEVADFVKNVVRTHSLSSHIVAFLYASLPTAAAEMIRENLLEEMGVGGNRQPHSALLLVLARGARFSPEEIEKLLDDSRQQIRVFCAQKIPFPTLQELCLSMLLETESFEFLLSRYSSRISDALLRHYGFSKESLRWFELHSEVDICHAEEGLAVIRDYLAFHRIDDAHFERILETTFAKNVFLKRYFPNAAAT